MGNYKQHMRRALELAANGWGNTSPNPMVGAVLLRQGRVIAEGYHKGPGFDHAEVVVISAAGRKVKGSTIVVNLEPCNCHGRTPPCTDLIIRSGVKRIVYGMKDPNPNVSGRGIAQLKKAGIEVVGPVLPKDCSSFNRIYVHWIRTGKPYVISKVAVSLDGKIATKSGDSKWITGGKCRERMHYWRGGVDAVLVGAETIRRDDPRLSARGVGRVKQPRPVVVTASGKLALDKRIWKRRPQPIVVCRSGNFCSGLKKRGIDVISLKASGSRIDWQLVLNELGRMGITSILVEGGGKVHSQLIKRQLAQYMVASMSTKLIGGAGKDWLPGWNVGKVSDSPQIKPDQVLVLDGDVVIEGKIEYQGTGVSENLNS